MRAAEFTGKVAAARRAAAAEVLVTSVEVI
jgi:hypothetical protein